MVIIPKNKPVIENLNSYYVDIKKLFEHYQGELGSGGFHFTSSLGEGAVFFDKDLVLGGVYRGKDGEVSGKRAVEFITKAAAGNSHRISVYQLDSEKINFWASLPLAKTIYKDLSTEFTDLEGLIGKMGSEKLTGYIEVFINGGRDSGLIFLQGGRIIGGSYSWEHGDLDESGKCLQKLLEMTKRDGGVFHVSKITMQKNDQTVDEAPGEKNHQKEVLDALEHLLIRFEEMFSEGRNNKTDFSILLKKKFVDMADRFAFLDPFAGEFEYSGKKVSFTGDAGDQELVHGVVAAVAELAGNLGIFAGIKSEVGQLLKKYGKNVSLPELKV